MFGDRNMIYKHLGSNLILPYDLILESFSSIKTTSGDDQTDERWQEYVYGLTVLRRWKRFDLINEILDKLREFKNSIYKEYRNDSSHMVQSFLNDSFNAATRLVPTKVKNEIDPHCDVMRPYVVTIGIASGNHKTLISSARSVEDFNSGPKDGYIVNKGDIYLTKVTDFHSVIKIDKTDNSPRYTLQYLLR